MDWTQIYQGFYDKLEPTCLDISQSFEKLGFVLLTLSLIVRIYTVRAQTFTGAIEATLPIILLVAFMASWPSLAGNQGYLAQMGKGLATQVQTAAQQNFCQLVSNFESNQGSAWNLLDDPVGTLTGFTALFLGFIGEGIMGIAKMFQYYFIAMALAVGPLYIALLAFQTTRSIGINFFMSTIALYLWDVAWRFIDVGTLNLLRVFFNTSLGNMLLAEGILFTAGWVILGYIFAPLVVAKAFIAGGNIGSAATGSVAGGAGTVAGIALGAGSLVKGMGGLGGIGNKTDSSASTGKGTGKSEGIGGQTQKERTSSSTSSSTNMLDSSTPQLGSTSVPSKSSGSSSSSSAGSTTEVAAAQRKAIERNPIQPSLPSGYYDHSRDYVAPKKESEDLMPASPEPVQPIAPTQLSETYRK